ncbi:MAG: hypothetical protein ABGY41_04775 [Candidatus Poribacteria bacterium]
MGSQPVFMLALFAVTVADHSAVPNAYVLAMILAKGKHLDPVVIFATAYLSVAAHENAAYWVGRRVPTPTAARTRMLRRILRGSEAVSEALARREPLWLTCGRLVAFVGLYVPFAAGEMRRPYRVFLALITGGTIAHLAAFGVAAYVLGDLVHAYAARVGFGWITGAIVLLMAAAEAHRRTRSASRRRSAP